MPIPLRSDYDAARVRIAARESKNANQVRRLLALAAIYNGASRAAFCPAASDLVFLAKASFVAEPHFYLGDIDALLASDVCQRVGKVFLDASMAPSA